MKASTSMKNYIINLINNGLKLGDKMRRHFGSTQLGVIVYEVKLITSEEIRLGLIMDEVAQQQLKYNSISAKDVLINIAKCGSFPRYIKTEAENIFTRTGAE